MKTSVTSKCGHEPRRFPKFDSLVKYITMKWDFLTSPGADSRIRGRSWSGRSPCRTWHSPGSRDWSWTCPSGRDQHPRPCRSSKSGRSERGILSGGLVVTADLVVLQDPVVLLRDVGPQQTGGYLSVASGREELPDVMEQGRHDGLGVRPVPAQHQSHPVPAYPAHLSALVADCRLCW